MFKTICFDPSDMVVCSAVSDPVASKDFGEYVVDDSHFVPMSEAVKRVTGGTLSPQEVRAMYDFSDGKDTGKKIPVDRSHRFTDLAEISVEARKTAEKVKQGLKEAKEQYEFEQKLENINSVSVDSVSKE